MAVYFAIFQILPIFVYELFETMQSSVTRSKTSITKSLPASFKLSIFVLYSESYNKIHCFSVRNKQFQGMKQLARLKGLKKSSCLKRKISTDKK